MLGDNRENSEDSRSYDIGFDVEGKVSYRIGPIQQFKAF